MTTFETAFSGRGRAGFIDSSCERFPVIMNVVARQRSRKISSVTAPVSSWRRSSIPRSRTILAQESEILSRAGKSTDVATISCGCTASRNGGRARFAGVVLAFDQGCRSAGR